MKRTILLLSLAFALPGASPAGAQQALMEDVGKANLPEQSIGADDLLAISVYRSPELTRTVRVDSAGSVELPLLAGPVAAAGLMPRELEDAIAEALREEGILVNPIVQVTVAEYASRPISVMGAVNKPVTFQAVGRVTLLDALARAEGLGPAAAQEILVTMPGAAADGSTRSLLTRIPVRRLIDEADPALNLTLTGGEEIRVPEAGRIFVVGNVERPGAYPVPDPRDATVLKLLAMAEGLAPYASRLAYIYREEPDTGVRHETEVELARILKRKAPDLPLEANDVLYIPDNRTKRAALTVIDRAVTFAAGTVSGILIWQRR